MMSVKWSFKMNVVKYQTIIFLHRYVSQFKSANQSRIYTNLFLSGKKESSRSFIVLFLYVFCLIHVKLWKNTRPLSNPLCLTLRKRINILLKLRTTLFNHRPKMFRQRSSNKTQLNMNSSNRIYTDSPRDLAAT